MSMYTMAPQPHYAYAAAPAPPPPRQYPGHGTSSAFSSSANPDEDWTKISDLAERRRIQNRIAQRNYRKKLKKRLEDLERRAGEDGAPTAEKQMTAKTPASKRTQTSSSKTNKAVSAKSMNQGHFSPPMAHDDELLFPPIYEGGRLRSHSPPYVPYSSYPPPDELTMAPSYPSPQPYPSPMTTAEAYPAFLAAPAPVTLPPMDHFNDAVKREQYLGDDGMGYIHYNYASGIGMSPANSFENPEAHTPPLSHSFDNSSCCSDAGFEYPTTPLSMPDSPEMF